MLEQAQTYQDSFELAKGAHYTILLDENLEALQSALEDEGYKVVRAPKGWSDPDIKKLASGWSILTRNSQDFIPDALRFDYDLIALEDVQFIDSRADRTNTTVQKIANALRRSRLASRKGNFVLKIHDDGSFHLRQLP